MSKKQAILRGTLILTIAGLISRILGFFYRIFLSRTFGAEGVGLYQLIFPIFTICFSITTAGIETAISRTVANRSSLRKEKESINILLAGILCSLILSFLCIFIIIRNSYFIANVLLGDSRCEPLLKILVFTLPFSSIHNCIAGYYYGKKQSKIPAICQLIEQTLRISIVFVLYYIFTEKGRPFPLSIAVLGLILGDAASAFFAAIVLRKKDMVSCDSIKGTSLFSSSVELLTLAFPLTINRLMINVLQSIEAVSIPAQLELFCHDSSKALRTYGVLNGMALPCILFPSAITTSAAAMLMPTVAEIQATGKRHEILNLTKKSCSLCFLLGLFCSFCFLISGRWIGTTLFSNETAGNFIITLAWICPFLYTNTAFQSVINGLGKTKWTLFINIIGLSIRIISVYLWIPQFGIKGYLWGLLISQLIISIASALILKYLYRTSFLAEHL